METSLLLYICKWELDEGGEGVGLGRNGTGTATVKQTLCYRECGFAPAGKWLGHSAE
jgi:hypothetical protein